MANRRRNNITFRRGMMIREVTKSWPLSWAWRSWKLRVYVTTSDIVNESDGPPTVNSRRKEVEMGEGNFWKIFEHVRQNCNVSFHLCFSLTHRQLTLRKRATTKGNYPLCFVVMVEGCVRRYQLYSQSTKNKTFTRKSRKSCLICMTTKWPVQRKEKFPSQFTVVSVRMQLTGYMCMFTDGMRSNNFSPPTTGLLSLIRLVLPPCVLITGNWNLLWIPFFERGKILQSSVSYVLQEDTERELISRPSIFLTLH
jgi:hypothetical protein